MQSIIAAEDVYLERFNGMPADVNRETMVSWLLDFAANGHDQAIAEWNKNKLLDAPMVEMLGSKTHDNDSSTWQLDRTLAQWELVKTATESSEFLDTWTDKSHKFRASVGA